MAQQQQQQSNDSGLGLLWVMVLVACAGFLIWYTGHEYITAFIFKIKLVEADLLALFSAKFQSVVGYLRNTDPSNVTFAEIMQVSTIIGNYMRYPIIVILSVLAVIMYMGNIKLKFRKTQSMKSLRAAEAVNWPQIIPVVKLDLVSQDLNKGPWATAQSPVEFSFRHNLLRIDPTAERLSRRKRQTPVPLLMRGEAKRILTMQLGPYFSSPEHCPIHVQAIFAACAAKINRDRSGCNDLLDQISRSADKEKLDFSGVKAILDKHKDTKLVKRVLDKHAYLTSVMASMIEQARHDGVFPTSSFIWLKPIDRRLWYVLNCVGRQTPYVEVSGPFAHWIAEKAMDRKIMVPMVEEAVEALEIAVKEVKFTDKEIKAIKEMSS